MRLYWNYRGLYGLQWLKIGNITSTLWYVPKNVKIPVHKHPGQQIELIPLYGANCIFNRIHESSDRAQSIPAKKFKSYTTPNGYYHFFTERTKSILFLNIITWLEGTKPSHPKFNYVNKQT